MCALLSTAADVIGAESAAGEPLGPRATIDAICNLLARGRNPPAAAARRGPASCATRLRSGTPATRRHKMWLLVSLQPEQAHGVPRVDRSHVLSGKTGRVDVRYRRLD